MLVFFIESSAIPNFFDTCYGKQERMFYISFLHKGSPRGEVKFFFLFGMG